MNFQNLHFFRMPGMTMLEMPGNLYSWWWSRKWRKVLHLDDNRQKSLNISLVRLQDCTTESEIQLCKIEINEYLHNKLHKSYVHSFHTQFVKVCERQSRLSIISSSGFKYFEIYRGDRIFWPDKNNQIPDIVCALNFSKNIFGVKYSYDSSLLWHIVNWNDHISILQEWSST